MLRCPDAFIGFNRSNARKWTFVIIRGILSFLFLAVSMANAADFGDIRINVEQPPQGESCHGYIEYRVSLNNRSSNRSHRVNIELSNINSGVTELRKISRLLDIAPQSQANVSIFQPSLQFYSDRLNVEIDGLPQSDGVPIRTAYSGHGWGSKAPLILLSQSISIADCTSHPGLKPPTTYEPAIKFVNVAGSSAEWSRNWLGYTRYDGLMIPASDFNEAPAQIQAAIWKYVEVGGTLAVLGKIEIPVPWASPSENIGSYKEFPVGFGTCMMCSEKDMSSIDEITMKKIKDAWKKTLAPWERSYSTTNMYNTFPVVEGTAIPIRGMFLLMFLFTILIGPVNLYFLAKNKKKLWILWTVPFFSILTCGVIFAYASFIEGWDITTRIEGFSIFDENSQKATTLAWAGYYSPLTLSEGFHFGLDTEITLETESYSRGYEQRDREIDWTNDQHLGQGWLNARIPTYLLLRKTEFRRERLTLQDNPDGKAVLNGLAKTILKLTMADHDGKIFIAENIAPGAVVKLHETGQNITGKSVRSFRDIYMQKWIVAVDDYAKSCRQYLCPDTYIAELDQAVFMEESIKNPRYRREHWIVFGIMKGRS